MPERGHLDPQIAAILDALSESGAPEYCDMSVAEARALHNATAGRLGAPFVDLARVEDCAIPGPAGNMPARLYDPAPGSDKATLLFLHGGGHVIGSLDSYDTLCRQLAAQSGCALLSLDYRMGPEHRFPAAVEDTLAAWAWLTTEGGSLGIDPERTAIGGDSAGGNLAAVGTNLARREGLRTPLLQLLIYPATGSYPNTVSQLEFATDHVLTRRLILWFHGLYLAPEDYVDPRWAPLLEPDLRGSPPSVVILAECDPLRDEGLAYASRLAASGADVTLKVYAGMVHPFFSWSGGVERSAQAVSFASAELARLNAAD